MQKVIWNDSKIWINDQLFFSFSNDSGLEQATALYKYLGLAYPKFFKMDLLSKVGYLCSELLLRDMDFATVDLQHTATFISTKDGCLEVDKKFLESTQDIPSPGLFVYTLPNIVLGEICIRYKFKGEQICYVCPEIDKEEMIFYLKDIFDNRNQKHCLCGHVNALETSIDVEMYWVDKDKFTSFR